jgi:hypothetical protein
MAYPSPSPFINLFLKANEGSIAFSFNFIVSLLLDFSMATC